MKQFPSRIFWAQTISVVTILCLTFTAARLMVRAQSTPASVTSQVVNSTGDGADTSPGDGTCSAADGTCTLRAAIQEANVAVSKQIDFSLPGNSTIILESALPTLFGNITINGPGPSALTVQRSTAAGTPAFRILTITTGTNVTATISGLTITNGRAPDGVTSNFAGNGTGGGGIFYSGGGKLIVSNCVVTGNRAGDGGFGNSIGGTGGSGGGILNGGDMTLINSVVTGNRAGDGGTGGTGANGGNAGGITGGSALLVINSTISNNFSGNGGNSLGNTIGATAGKGGGISGGGGVFEVFNSTISGNQSGRGGNGAGNVGGQGGDGGGIYSVGPLNIANTTLTNNITGEGGTGSSTGTGNLGGHGGGLYTENFVNVANCTITNNATTGFYATEGGGIYKFPGGGRVDLKNTIVANNTAGGGPGPDLSGSFNSLDYNLIKNTNGATFTGTTSHNIVGADPLLGSLSFSGGPTQTMAPQSGSPVIDAGSNANLPPDTVDLDGDGDKFEPVPIDQRGGSRILNGTVEIGSVEVSLPGAAPFQLMLDTSGPAANQLAALDSVLYLRDPFVVVNGANVFFPGADHNTRVVLLATNLQLLEGETSADIVVNLVDANSISYDIPAIDVRAVPDVNFFQVIFRLPDGLPVGTCAVKLKARGQVSNTGTFRIKG